MVLFKKCKLIMIIFNKFVFVIDEKWKHSSDKSKTMSETGLD